MKPTIFHICRTAALVALQTSLLSLPCSSALEFRQATQNTMPLDSALPLKPPSSNTLHHTFVTLMSVPTSRRNIKEPAEANEMYYAKEEMWRTRATTPPRHNASQGDQLVGEQGGSQSSELSSTEVAERGETPRALAGVAPSSSSLQAAGVGHLWVIRESSDPKGAPTLSEYIPEPEDTYVDYGESPWKLVKSPSRGAHLVVEPVSVDQWNKEKADRKRSEQEKRSIKHVARKRRRRRRQGLRPNHANATGHARTDSVQHSWLYLRLAPPLRFLGSSAWSFGRRLGGTLLKTGATVSDMGLVAAQAWGLTIMLGLLLVLLIIDRGCPCCGRKASDEESCVDDGATFEGRFRGKRSSLSRHLTSWEVIPGVEYIEPPSEYHLG